MMWPKHLDQQVATELILDLFQHSNSNYANVKELAQELGTKAGPRTGAQSRQEESASQKKRDTHKHLPHSIGPTNFEKRMNSALSPAAGYWVGSLEVMQKCVFYFSRLQKILPFKRFETKVLHESEVTITKHKRKLKNATARCLAACKTC